MPTPAATTAALDGDEARFRCRVCDRTTTWTGYTPDAFRAPLELKCAHCGAETFFTEVVNPGLLVACATN